MMRSTAAQRHQITTTSRRHPPTCTYNSTCTYSYTYAYSSIYSYSSTCTYRSSCTCELGYLKLIHHKTGIFCFDSFFTKLSSIGFDGMEAWIENKCQDTSLLSKELILMRIFSANHWSLEVYFVRALRLCNVFLQWSAQFKPW